MLRIKALFSGLMVRTQKRKKVKTFTATGSWDWWNLVTPLAKKFLAIYSKQFQVN